LALPVVVALLVQQSLELLRLWVIQRILVCAYLLVKTLLEQLLLALIIALRKAIDLLKVMLIMTLEDLLVWLGLVLLKELLLRLLVKLLLLQIQRLDVAEVV
jgi:hypothetical protein